MRDPETTSEEIAEAGRPYITLAAVLAVGLLVGAGLLAIGAV